MICRSIRMPDGTNVIVCGGRPARARCQVTGCRRAHEALCDHPLECYEAGRTCSMRLCSLHRAQTGPDTDLCPAHARDARLERGAR